MKSYTDLEQSKKLAEILPFDSADMYWWYSGKRYYIEAIDDGDFNEEGDIRAWSLAALLGVLPKCYSLGRRKNGKYYVCMTHIKHNISEFDNAVDACYEIIIKLNELNLL